MDLQTDPAQSERQEPDEAATPRVEPVTQQPRWRRFDAVWYAARYREALAEHDVKDGELEAFYWQKGCRFGHSPNMFFDETWYLATYPDIAAHVAAEGARSGFEHYIRDGYKDRSPHWLFDEHYYLSSNRDVTQDVLQRQHLVNGYDHYLAIGNAEFRTAHRFFDPLLYEQNADESDEVRSHAGGPFIRFLLDDCRAGSTARLSWYFDPVWYLKTYPELREEIASDWTCALHHFLCSPGKRRHAGLEWFSEEYYGATYPDVLAAVNKGAFRNTYEHFVKFGAAERRRPHADVDLVAHYRAIAVQASIERGDYDNAFTHWVAQRYAAEEGGSPQPVVEAQSKQLFARMADTMLPQFARSKLDFTVRGEPAVSVIIVLHNKFALTMTALSSLRAVYAGGIELILVDSGSRDETRHIDRYLRGARVMHFPNNVGFVAACNEALAHATAPAVLYLNNDLMLGIKSIELALARLDSDPGIGAVGAKFIRTNGLLQEAGSIIWRDGSTVGYLRDGDPALPEANFVRDVDFCSGAFLLVRASCLKALGGFDDDFRPAYYEETDLCVRLRKSGYRVVYDPSVVVQHVEFGSASSSRSARMIQRNHKVFVEKHLDWLRYKHPPRPRNALFARSPKAGRGRILFIEDRIPMRDLGSGYVRSNDIVHAMASLGYHVSVYPVYPATSSVLQTLGDFPETVEVLYDRGQDQLPQFIAERSGYYDIVWIGRTHNLERLLPVLGDASSALPDHSFVLDTEAIAAPRLVEQARVLGRTLEHDLETMLRRELDCAYFCQKIIAVNERDAALIRLTGHSKVSVLGHLKEPVPTPASWAERSDLLFLGAVHETSSPNYDSLSWFVKEVLPLLDGRLPPEVRFRIAGYVDRRVDMSPLGRNRRVDLLGPVGDLAALYGGHRVFVAPTRFAGGIPFKVHEAAAHGLPVVATELLCRQVGWTDGTAILSGGTDDASAFADQVVALYDDETRWNGVRAEALRRIEAENGRAAYLDRLDEILADVTADAHPRQAAR